MFPIKVVAEISKILLNYTDSFIIDKNYDIRLNTNSESLGICRAYINDLRPFQGYNDFLINGEIARDLKDIKPKTAVESRDNLGNIIITGSSTLSKDAKDYREINATITRGHSITTPDDERDSFISSVWSKIGSINYTNIPDSELVGTNKFLEIPVEDNDGNHETLLISTYEFFFGKKFKDMSAGLIDTYHPYQTNHPEKRFVMVRVRYVEINLYMLLAIAV